MEKGNAMIASGTILIDKNALRPQCFQLRDHAHLDSWMSVSHNLNPQELEKELSTTGWTFFYMASAIRATAFGFDRAKTLHSALKRAIANAKLQRCNCLEIDSVATHSFLGIPYTSVAAHLRHVQKGMVFSGQ
jgi:hypothetical protein